MLNLEEKKKHFHIPCVERRETRKSIIEIAALFKFPYCFLYEDGVTSAANV